MISPTLYNWLLLLFYLVIWGFALDIIILFIRENMTFNEFVYKYPHKAIAAGIIILLLIITTRMNDTVYIYTSVQNYNFNAGNYAINISGGI